MSFASYTKLWEIIKMVYEKYEMGKVKKEISKTNVNI